MTILSLHPATAPMGGHGMGIGMGMTTTTTITRTGPV